MRGRASVVVSDGSERESVPLRDGDVVSFGRGSECDLRFGHAPLRDSGVPRLAGWLLVVGGRVCVEAPSMNACGASPVLRHALRVQAPQGRGQNLEPGSVYAPCGSVFEVLVRGTTEWAIDVAIQEVGRSAAGTHGDSMTVGQSLPLTERQWEILRAYAEPVLRGGVDPATHSQV